jgi:hypothetical protein
MPQPIPEGIRSRDKGMRDRPRRRRDIPRPLAHFLGATLFRYSPGRRAYVLRIVGGRWGPVLREHH